jgi:hypothetical protein
MKYKDYDIYVAYMRGTPQMMEYHRTAWGSDEEAKAIATAASIYESIDEHGFRFRGVNVCDPSGEVIHRLRRNDG